MKPHRYNEIAKEQEWHNFDSTPVELGMNRTITWHDGKILDESNNTMPPEQKNKWNEKNGEDNNIFYLKWIWYSILKKKDRTELLENQQWKE